MNEYLVVMEKNDWIKIVTMGGDNIHQTEFKLRACPDHLCIQDFFYRINPSDEPRSAHDPKLGDCLEWQK